MCNFQPAFLSFFERNEAITFTKGTFHRFESFGSMTQGIFDQFSFSR